MGAPIGEPSISQPGFDLHRNHEVLARIGNCIREVVAVRYARERDLRVITCRVARM